MLGSPPEPRQLAPGEKGHKRGQPFTGGLAHQIYPHRVTAKRKEKPVSQRQHPGIPPDQIQGDRHHRIAKNFPGKRQCPHGNRQRMIGGQQGKKRQHHQRQQDNPRQHPTDTRRFTRQC
ncbi:hypothetical protein SDC9_184085 [bioreactor metagenome]|uniref:Uncharacterized protein n=1 Tax=bioreactor metagenome TaxID=1076179 RepID=A0A645HDH0_9ZZZZ